MLRSTSGRLLFLCLLSLHVATAARQFRRPLLTPVRTINIPSAAEHQQQQQQQQQQQGTASLEEIDLDELVASVLEDFPARETGVREEWATRTGVGRKEPIGRAR